MNYSLNALYQVVGISKQAFHQRMERKLRHHGYEHQLLFLIYQLREDHPTMCCRDMYYKLQPECLGRDAFELFCKQHGLMSEKSKNHRKTTDSKGVTRFDNLTVDLILTHVNQLWVSDITYIEVDGKFYYITFIMDAFSRRILGYSVSSRLFTEQTTLPALQMAVEIRKEQNLKGTIIHSDGGGQYYDKDFLKLTKRLQMSNSMCEYPWENGKAERINGVIKNNYLIHWNITNYAQLLKQVDRAVKLYNQEKPHIALKRLTPIEFENWYIESGKTSDGEISATEYKNHTWRDYSPSGCGKTSSDSKIALEYV